MHMPRTTSSRRIQIRSVSHSLRLNGSSEYVALGSLGAIAQTLSAFTLFARFKGEALNLLMAVLGDMNNSAQNHVNYQTNSAKKLLTTLITTSGAKALVGNKTVHCFSWNNGAVSYDGTTLKFVLNGITDNTTTHSGTVTASTFGVSIGTGSAPIGGAFRYFSGAISDVRFWNRALTDKENEDLHFEGRNDASMRVGLIGEWTLSGNALDTSGGGNNGTLVGGAFDSSDTPSKDRQVVLARSLASVRTVII